LSAFDAKKIADLINRIHAIEKMKDQIRGQMNELLAINQALRKENARLRDIISKSKLTRMVLINGGQNGQSKNDEGPGNDAS